jgi:Domain of Unknown Function (DUF1599).
MNKTKRFEQITKEMLSLYEKKNADYGDSFSESFKEFGIIMPIIRLSDKLNRMKRLAKADAQVKSESIEDTLIDIANYAVMTLLEVRGGKPTINLDYPLVTDREIEVGELCRAEDGTLLRCTDKGKCADCYYNEGNGLCATRAKIKPCVPTTREDGKYVFFIKVEDESKTGEED